MPGPIVEAACAAALAVARSQGLRVTDAVPVGTGSNVIVHLRPAPVVARVMTGTAALHPDPRAWLARELAVGTFLASRDVAIVPPATEVDPGPFSQGGLWLSFWQHVVVSDTPLGAAQVGGALRRLHDALAAYPGPLPPRSNVLGEIDWLLRALSADGDAAALRAERDRLVDVICEPAAAPQPLHGDASLSNLLSTRAGPCFNDFEDVCVGPVAWDVAGLVSDARERCGDAFAAEVLTAYGGDLDPSVLERIDQVHALYGGLWRRYLRLRRPGPPRGPTPRPTGS